MRCFAAIDLGEDARAAVGAEQRRLAGAMPGSAVRFVRPEHLHVTLVFVANLPEERVAGLVDRFEKDIRMPRFEIAFGGLGVFPDAGAPRALWLDIARGKEETTALYREVLARMQDIGVEPERRPFQPHLTLARWRHSRRSDHPRGMTAVGLVAKTPVDAVTLYRSQPTQSGPGYTVLARAGLGGAARPH